MGTGGGSGGGWTTAIGAGRGLRLGGPLLTGCFFRLSLSLLAFPMMALRVRFPNNLAICEAECSGHSALSLSTRSSSHLYPLPFVSTIHATVANVALPVGRCRLGLFLAELFCAIPLTLSKKLWRRPIAAYGQFPQKQVVGIGRTDVPVAPIGHGGGFVAGQFLHGNTTAEHVEYGPDGIQCFELHGPH